MDVHVSQFLTRPKDVKAKTFCCVFVKGFVRRIQVFKGAPRLLFWRFINPMRWQNIPENSRLWTSDIIQGSKWWLQMKNYQFSGLLPLKIMSKCVRRRFSNVTGGNFFQTISSVVLKSNRISAILSLMALGRPQIVGVDFLQAKAKWWCLGISLSFLFAVVAPHRVINFGFPRSSCRLVPCTVLREWSLEEQLNELDRTILINQNVCVIGKSV